MDSPLIKKLKNNFTEFAGQECLNIEGQGVTYREMDVSTLYFAQQLAGQGIGAGSLVGIWLEPGLEVFTALIGLWRINAVPVPLNIKAPVQQNQEIIAGLDLAGVLAGPEKRLPVDGLNLISPPSLEGAPEDGFQEASPQADDLAALLFTSGSTGISKGVMVSHRALGGNAAATAKALGLTSNDRWLFNTPFTFTSAICHFLTSLMAGATVKAMDRFCFPPEMIALLNDFRATGFGGSPIQNRWLVEAVEDPGQLPYLKKAMSSGDALPDHTYHMFSQNLPQVKLFNVYGMTELAGRFCILDQDEGQNQIGSVGKPIEGLRCMIRDQDTAELLPPGEVGEIYAQGSLLMDGYYRLPDKTAETLTEFGVRSGDLGYKDEEGFVYLVSRKDDVFKSSGEKVSTVLIANTLLETGVFSDVAVVGVSDDYLGMVPKVFFVPRDGREFNRKEILSWLNDRLPSSHIPPLFEELAEIPRTGSGKLDRKKLALKEN